MDQIRQPDIRLSAARQFSSMSEYFQHQNSMLHHSADSDLKTRIPVYVPCFNNPSYLEMMVNQLVGLGFCNVVVIDNGSTFPPMLSYFEQLPESVSLIRQLQNRGPRDLFTDPTNYAQLPDHFCLTDPDLQFNPDLPATFLDDLIEATETYRIGKAGFALQISDHENMLQRKFPIGSQEYFIWEWEEQFWKTPLSRTRSGDQIYRAEVDTTFALYNKKYFDPTYPDCLKAVRIADRLACRHLPWYRDNLLTPDERDNYRATARFSVYAGAQQSELAETQSSPAVTQAAPVETARLSAERSDSATTPAAIGDTTLSRIVGPFRYLGRLVARLVDVVVRRAP
ncbi:MAG: glycosyltransferase [Rhodospirillales bacterium]|nr:glycosyltransferase [Rhodospirillales bacterium]